MIFKPAARYPADPRAVFILALSVFSGITALALEVAPESLTALLPTWAILTWGTLLATGSLTALIGMAFQSINGIVLEQIGSVMVAATTIFYAGIAFWTVGSGSIQSLGIILAWGLACLVRWAQLQVLIHSAVKRKRKREILEEMYAKIEEYEARERARRWHQ